MSHDLTILSQYLKDLSFENPHAPHNVLADAEKPDLDVQVNVKGGKIKDRVFEVILNLSATAKGGDHVGFIVECDYAAVVELGEHIQEQDRDALLLVEVPRLLFPFAREIVATATHQGGFAPLYVNPLDFRQFLALKDAEGHA